MFDVSFTELMVIGVIALIVIGPERLPKVARTVGHLLGRAQRYVSDVKSDIKREIELDELRKFKSEMEDAAQTVNTSMRDTEASLRKSGDTLRSELDATARDAASAVTQNGDAAAVTASIATPAADPLVPSTTLPLTDVPDGVPTPDNTMAPRSAAMSTNTILPPGAGTSAPGSASPVASGGASDIPSGGASTVVSPTDAPEAPSLSRTGSIYSLPVAALPADAPATTAAVSTENASDPVAPSAPKIPGMSPIAAMPPIDSPATAPASVPAGTDAKAPPSSGTAT